MLKKLPLLTSLGFLLPIIFYDNVPDIITILLFCTVISSWFFWFNCVKYSIFQKIDGIFAKLSILSVILYKIFINTINQKIFFLTTFFMFLSFIGSHIYSKKIWQCNCHILFHTLSHILCIVALMIAFATYEIYPNSN